MITPSQNWTAFPCKIYRPRNPAMAIEMIKANTCDVKYASASSDNISFKICTEKESFNQFNTSMHENECCKTNLFGSDFKSNKYSEIDTLDNDGGEALGKCEGFETGGTGAYIAIKNDSIDKFCIIEIGFYGSAGLQTSTIDMPFGVYSFDDTEFDGKKVRQTY